MTDTVKEASIYQQMKARDIDMSWYERGERGRTDNAVPLDDSEYSALSVYLFKVAEAEDKERKVKK